MDGFTKKYSKINWSKTNAEIAEMLGVTKQTVSDARRRRGIKSPISHGGARKGAGQKPCDKSKKRAPFFARLSPATIGKIVALSQRWGCSQGRAVERAVLSAAENSGQHG